MPMSKRLQELYEQKKEEIAPYFRHSTEPKRGTNIRLAPEIKSRGQKSKPQSKARRQNSNPLAKFHQVDELLQRHHISPDKELVYDSSKTFPLDEANTQVIDVGKATFNAPRAFTILTAIFDASLIYFGAPGTGKTSLAEYVSSAVYNLPLEAIQQATIYGHPELTEEKMIAMFDVIKMMNGQKELIVRDFAKLPARIIDEVNRIPPSKLSILYQLVDRGWATYQNELIKANPGPLFATANSPDSGNYSLPEPFLDRFNIGVVVQDLNPFHYAEFARGRIQSDRTPSRSTLDGRIQNSRTRERRTLSLADPITKTYLIRARKYIQSADFSTELMSQLAHFAAELKTCDMAGTTAEKKNKANALYKKPGPLCQDCGHYAADTTICSQTENALSARTVASAFSYAQGLASWRGSRHVGEDDLRYAVTYSSWFKLTPTRQATAENQHFANDRLAWTQYLWETAKRTYEENCQSIPAYKEITELVFQHSLYTQGKAAKSAVTRKELESLLQQTVKIDSLAKFPLAVALTNLYQQSKK